MTSQGVVINECLQQCQQECKMNADARIRMCNYSSSGRWAWNRNSDLLDFYSFDLLENVLGFYSGKKGQKFLVDPLLDPKMGRICFAFLMNKFKNRLDASGRSTSLQQVNGNRRPNILELTHPPRPCTTQLSPKRQGNHFRTWTTNPSLLASFSQHDIMLRAKLASTISPTRVKVI